MSETTQASSNNNWIWIGAVALIALLGVGWFFTGSVSPEAPAPVSAIEATGLEPAPIVGHPAPEFTLTSLDGEAVTLSDFAGQPVILNFWATWCGPCRVEMPHLESAFAEHKDDVAILGVNLTARDSIGEVPEFVDEFGLTFPIILDESGEVAETYQVIGQPASVFIDKNGVIHELFRGPVNEEFINERIEELLKL